VTAARDRARWLQPAVVRRLRSRALAGRISLRRPFAARRAEPSFLIIGAQRCGTTSLYRYLAQHPDVEQPLVKEVHYFSSSSYLRGESWYRAHFPKTPPGPTVTFEATPYYLFHPLAPRRIAAALPSSKFIVCVRDPAHRAYSHYQHSVQRGYESLPFESALAAEPSRLDGEARRLELDEHYDSHAYKAFSYFTRGLYVDQLRRWERYVPHDRTLVLSSDDLYTSPAETYGKVLAWLGLRAWEPTSFDVFERSRAVPTSSDSTRAALVDAFRPHNQRLFDYLGRDLGWPT